MDIIYLDQNIWIELAKAHSGKVSSGPIADLYPKLISAVQSGRVLFPLSVTHVLETSKISNPVRRRKLAETQARLSRGFAYRSRASRIEVEVSAVLHRLFDISPPNLPEHWVIAPGFLQAFEPMDAMIAPPSEVDRLVRINAYIDPASQYVEFMTDQDEARRQAAHIKLTADTKELVARITARRAKLTGASTDLRRRAYAVELFMEHQDRFLRILGRLGFSFEQLEARGADAVRSLIDDVPTLNVEVQMAAQIESETRVIDSNDVFDIQAFCTAVPYSSWIFAEKASIARAQRAKLHTEYQVRLSNSLTDLAQAYDHAK